MSKGILQVHPPICDCPGCRISSPVNRGRLAEKRTIPLPPSRVPKKELSSIFSHSEDSQESDKSNGQHPEVKQEEDLHISIMKRRIHTHWDLNISFRETSCSRDSELSTIISSLQQSRQLVMPESQSRCEFKRSSLDVGLAAADEILGKRRVCSPNSSSECPLESKKARSESPKETSQTAALEEAAAQMTPEEHYRRMVAALGEHGSFEEQQQQRLYQLANSMAVPSHGGRAAQGPRGCSWGRPRTLKPFGVRLSPTHLLCCHLPSSGCLRRCARRQVTGSCSQRRQRCSHGSRRCYGSRTWPGKSEGAGVVLLWGELVSWFEGQVSANKRQELLLEMENVNPLPPNYYSFEIKGLSGKDMGIRNINSLLGKLK
uniref:Sterile alpha motif domain containing 11 n=1 Tax=Ficedula albicollis TaxID=59894 RepID=U3JY59_FICAL